MTLLPAVLLFVTMAADLKADLQSLINAERSFAALAEQKGIKESFLANLADDSILFRPTAVRGKEWMEKNPAPTSQLIWAPAFADIAVSGDLGYTTGPWEIRRTPQDPPAGFGHYVTLWRKQANGAWKVVLDSGIGHGETAKPTAVDSPAIPAASKPAQTSKAIEGAITAIRNSEREFPLTTEKYASRLADDARVYRNDSLPFVGRKSFEPAITGRAGSFAWKLEDVAIASSADFGYSYGSVDVKGQDGKSEPSNFVRIWKKQRNGDWKVVLDLVF